MASTADGGPAHFPQRGEAGELRRTAPSPSRTRASIGSTAATGRHGSGPAQKSARPTAMPVHYDHRIPIADSSSTRSGASVA
ncbi:hypothetical protein, partial [Streptomyces griseoviridis]|uniref:hypothetical protein n=1 Tax=Streptomyces griseoviridis TaxID=45398 RepID=UPI001E628C27